MTSRRLFIVKASLLAMTFAGLASLAGIGIGAIEGNAVTAVLIVAAVPAVMALGMVVMAEFLKARGSAQRVVDGRALAMWTAAGLIFGGVSVAVIYLIG